MRTRKPRTAKTAWITSTPVDVVLALALEPEIVVFAVGATISLDCAVACTMSTENGPEHVLAYASKACSCEVYRKHHVAIYWLKVSRFGGSETAQLHRTSLDLWTKSLVSHRSRFCNFDNAQ